MISPLNSDNLNDKDKKVEKEKKKNEEEEAKIEGESSKEKINKNEQNDNNKEDNGKKKDNSKEQIDISREKDDNRSEGKKEHRQKENDDDNNTNIKNTNFLKILGEKFAKKKDEEDLEVNKEVEEMERENKEEEEIKLKKEQEEEEKKKREQEEEEEKREEQEKEKKKMEREEEELIKYLKMNYYLENQIIRNAQDKKEEIVKPLHSNRPTEATLVEQMNNLDKKQIPKNVKFFLNGVLIKTVTEKQKIKKQPLMVQNISVKPNDVRILGKEKDIKGELKEMPEELDTILQEKKEIKQNSDIQKMQNTLTGDTPNPKNDECLIF